MILQCIDEVQNPKWVKEIKVGDERTLGEVLDRISEAHPAKPSRARLKLVVRGRIVEDGDMNANMIVAMSRYSRPIDASSLEDIRKVTLLIISEPVDKGSGSSSERLFIDEASLDAAKKWLTPERAISNSSSAERIKSVLSHASREERNNEGAESAPNQQAQEEPADAREPLPQAPNWLDWGLLARIAVGFMLFSQSLSMSYKHACMVALFTVLYYAMETGILRYVLASISQERREDSLFRYMEEVLKICVGVPSTPGLVVDVFAFLGSFFLSLLPTWEPRGNQEI